MDRELALESDLGLVWVSVKEYHKEIGQPSGTQRARGQILGENIQKNGKLLLDTKHQDYYRVQDQRWFAARRCSKSHRGTPLTCCNTSLDNRYREENHLTCCCQTLYLAKN